MCIVKGPSQCHKTAVGSEYFRACPFLVFGCKMSHVDEFSFKLRESHSFGLIWEIKRKLTEIKIICKNFLLTPNQNLKMINDCFSKFSRLWTATKISSSVLPFCDCVEDGLLNLLRFVMKIQMAQHCNTTQQ